MLYVACCWCTLFGVCCCSLSAACCLLSVARCVILVVVGGSLFAVCSVWFYFNT